nr:MAG TPA: tail spike [Caudoviricetes sp.]
MAFDPPLGSSSPAVLLDNATRLDNLLNSLALVFPDRAGELLYTWRGIHQNLIPLSKQYMTLAAAQADIVNIPVGSTTYYRSPDDSALAVEVMNVAGTLQPTGRKMPSQNSVNQALIAAGQVATASSVRDNQLHGMSMPDRRTLAADFTQYLDAFSSGGSSVLNGSATYADRVLLSISSFSTPFATAACTLTLTGAGRTLFSQGFFDGETLTDGVLTTPYYDVAMRQFIVDSVSASTFNTWVLKGSIKLPRAFSATEARVLRDRKNRIPIGIASSAYSYTVDTLAFDAANDLLYVAVSRTVMIAAGYADTTEGAQKYFWDTYGGIILSQKSTASQTLPEYTLFFSEAGAVTAVTDQNCTATIQVTKKLSLDVGKMQSNANAVNIAANSQAYAADRLRELNLELRDYQTNIGSVGNYGSQVSYSATMNGGSIFTLNKLSLSTNVRRLVMTMTDGLGTSQSITLLEGESTAGAVLTTPYVDFVFQPLTLNTLSINTGTGRTTFKIPTTLPGELPADTTRIIRDRAGYFDAYQPSTIFTGTTRGVTYESATGSLIVALMNADVTAAGYALTTAGVIQYVVDKLAGYVFSQVTAVSAAKTFCNLFKLASGAVTLTTDGNVTLTGTFSGPKLTTDINTTYGRYEVVVKNTADYATGNRPVAIKCKFNKGEVPSDRCIVVTDADGTAYPSQWAGEGDFNPRRGSTLSYWEDGSLRSGELLLLDNIAANTSKKYLLKAYPTQQNASSYNRTNQETATSLLVTADDGTQVRFDSVVGWLPYKLTRDSVLYTKICQQLYITVTGTAWSIVEATYTNYAYKIISDGPVFTEIETTFYNGAMTGNVAIAAGLIKHTYRTRVFKNGYVQIDAVARLQSALAANALFGCMTRIQLNSTATKTYRNEYNAIWTDNSVLRSVSIRNAGGDTIRDSAEASTLGNRPPIAGLTANATYVRFDGGWQAGATYGSGTTTLGAPAGWTWPVSFTVNLNESLSDATALSNVELNPVVGFASLSSVYPRVRQAKLASRLGDIISGIAAWNALDASSTDNGNGMFNTIAGDIVRMLHLKIGTLDTVYAKFDAWATTWYGGIGNIHLGAAADSKSLQFASRLVLPQLWWLYKLAVMNGDTAKQTALKTAIGNMAADCYSAFGTVGSANSNFYAAAFRSWAMAVSAGIDPSGNYTAAMTMVDGQFSSSTYFAGVKGIITDNVQETIPKRRYLHYQMYAWNNYLVGCKAAGRASVLDMRSYALKSVSGYGGLKEVDYCIAESRRGQPTTVGFMLYPLLHSGDNSCLEAAERLLGAFDEYGGSNTNGQIKLWDLDFYSVISTTFSEYTFACNIMADAWMQYWLDNNQ